MISKRGDFCIKAVGVGALVSSAPTEKSAPMLCQWTYCIVGALETSAPPKVYFTILTPFTTYTPRFSERSDVAFFITSLPSIV